MSNPSKKGIYHGWWIVITSLLMMATVYSAMITLPGVFTVFVTEDFGVTRTAFTAHITICTLACMVASLFVGKLFQKYNPKILMAVSAVIVTLCFLGYSFATSVIHFYVISALVGFFGLFLSNVPISILINSWFGPKMKGKAMGIAMVGSGIGSMVLNPVLTAINEAYSWRMSYRLLALLVLVLVLPLILLKVTRSPEDKGLARLGDDPNAVTVPGGAVSGLSAGQALKTSLFWIMFLTFFLFSATTTIFNTNAIPYMTDVGIDAVFASTMMSLSALGVIIGKLALGTISDKWNAKVASSAAIACLILGLVCFLGLPKLALLAPAATFLFGLGNANATVTMPLIANDMMGNRDFGTLFGYASVSSTLGASVGPLFGAMVFDSTGSYAAAWSSDIILMVVMLLTLHLCYKIRSRVYAKLGVES